MPMIAKPSYQSLYLEMRYNGIKTGCGTGFVYSAGKQHFLITNRHNVTGLHQDTRQPLTKNAPTPNEVLILHNRIGTRSWIEKVERIRDTNDEPLWIEHPVFGEKVDCVALRLTQLDEVALYPYNEYDGHLPIAIGPADIVSVIGFPFGMKAGGCAVWATGFVASEPSIDYRDLPLLLIDCRGRKGQSGSPVIAYRSGGMIALEGGGVAASISPAVRAIGIYSGRVNEESDLCHVWKMEAVREIVRAATGTFELSHVLHVGLS